MKPQASCLLIGGPGRSGTNVLKEVLGKHASVLALPFETRITVDPDGLAPTLRLIRSAASPFVGEEALLRLDEKLERVARRSPLDIFARFCERTTGAKFAHRGYRDWELEAIFPGFAEHKRQLMRDLTMIEFSGAWAGARGGGQRTRRLVAMDDKDGKVTRAMSRFLNEIYTDALSRAGKLHFVDDNTFNILYATELMDLLPTSRLVHMVRDPRDVVASYVRQRWTPKNLRDALKYYVQVMESWLDIRKLLDKNRLMEVRLEDLCAEPENVLKGIVTWAGLTFESSLLTVPLNKANSGRWSREFDAGDRALMTSTLEPFLDIYGYSTQAG